LTAERAPGAGRAESRPTVARCLGRAVAGLGLGWIWSSCAGLTWIVLAAAAYRDLDRALVGLKSEPWTPVALAGYVASALAAFFGGLVGPLVPATGDRARRPVLTSSVRGGTFGAALGTAAGFLAGWACLVYAPRSMLFVWVALGLGTAAGLVGGWLGGRGARA